MLTSQLIVVIALAVLAVGAVALIACLTVKHLRELKKKNNTKVVTKLNKVVKELKKDATKVTFDDLEKLEDMAKESPYVVAEYDPDADEVVKVERAKNLERPIQTRLKNSPTGVLEVCETV